MPARKGRKPAPPVQLQPRDRQMMFLLYLCDGLMTQDQIIRTGLWPNSDNARNRLRKLYYNRYLNRLNKDDKKRQYPELVYWLAKKGYDEVELLLGEPVDRLNKLARSQSPMSTWPHHFQVVDFRLKVMDDVKRLPEWELSRWYTDGYFRSRAWKAKVAIKDKLGESVLRSVIPDSFFAIWRWVDKGINRKQVFAFTLELDRGTEPLQSLTDANRVTIAEKIQAGAALFDSSYYRQQFGLKNGRCLMVTTGPERAKHMRHLAQKAGVGWAWYFADFEQVTDSSCNILTDSVWGSATYKEPISILAENK